MPSASNDSSPTSWSGIPTGTRPRDVLHGRGSFLVCSASMASIWPTAWPGPSSVPMARAHAPPRERHMGPLRWARRLPRPDSSSRGPPAPPTGARLGRAGSGSPRCACGPQAPQRGSRGSRWRLHRGGRPAPLRLRVTASPGSQRSSRRWLTWNPRHRHSASSPGAQNRPVDDPPADARFPVSARRVRGRERGAPPD
jgi:hypothetical protein